MESFLAGLSDLSTFLVTGFVATMAWAPSLGVTFFFDMMIPPILGFCYRVARRRLAASDC